MAGVIALAEAIARFLAAGSGCGSGSGSGSGYGFGSGCGSGCGCGSSYDSSYDSSSGSGCGSSYGSGSGCGSSYSDGDGDGFGFGFGFGSGCGCGDGFGSGSGCGSGIATFCGDPVHSIDGVQTIIHSVHGNTAMGAILQADLTLRKCYVVKGGGYFAHGDTLPAAMEALRDKIFEDMPEEERIEGFLNEFEPNKQYPTKLFYDWHHRLTGSCEMGRNDFAKHHGIDIDSGMMTREEFAELTKDAYGGEVIRRLMERMGGA